MKEHEFVKWLVNEKELKNKNICSYCKNGINNTIDKFCDSCGAPNENYVGTTNSACGIIDNINIFGGIGNQKMYHCTTGSLINAI
jgi:predicted amidophosphoribosyltransferase